MDIDEQWVEFQNDFTAIMIKYNAIMEIYTGGVEISIHGKRWFEPVGYLTDLTYVYDKR